MSENAKSHPIAVEATAVPANKKISSYPEPFYSRMLKREKRQLGDVFGLRNFGVNMTRIAPGGETSLLHTHTKQDEFIYILEGTPTLVTEDGEMLLSPGMCAGFPAKGIAHQLVNRADTDVIYLEIGDRTPGDEGIYPRDDLKAGTAADGSRYFTRKDGSAYD